MTSQHVLGTYQTVISGAIDINNLTEEEQNQLGWQPVRDNDPNWTWYPQLAPKGIQLIYRCQGETPIVKFVSFETLDAAHETSRPTVDLVALAEAFQKGGRQ